MARRLAWVCLAGLGIVPFAAAGPPPPAQVTAADESSDDLALAAACLDRGEETAAVVHLSRHLAAHPDRSLVRFSLAELLWRRDRLAEACGEDQPLFPGTPPPGADGSRPGHAPT